MANKTQENLKNNFPETTFQKTNTTLIIIVIDLKITLFPLYIYWTKVIVAMTIKIKEMVSCQ